MVRWRFDDLFDSTFAVFEINPDAGGSPALSTNLTDQSTVAPGGKTVLFQGSDSPSTIDFSGTILSQTQLTLYNTWFGKRHQIRLTDDLGRQYMIFITKFTPKRVYSGTNFWRHTFDVSAIVVE